MLTRHLHLPPFCPFPADRNANWPTIRPQPVDTYIEQGLAYLETADYTVSNIPELHPERPMTLYKGPHSLFRKLAPKYKLNKAEYLQLYNLRPSTQVMLELVIEEVCCPCQSSFVLVPGRLILILLSKAGSRFSEDDLLDILNTCQAVFDEEEAEIPDGAEFMKMERIPNKLLGAKKTKRKVPKKKA